MGSGRFRSIFCGPNYVSPVSIGHVSRSHRASRVYVAGEPRKPFARNIVKLAKRCNAIAKYHNREQEEERKTVSIQSALPDEHTKCTYLTSRLTNRFVKVTVLFIISQWGKKLNVHCTSTFVVELKRSRGRKGNIHIYSFQSVSSPRN